MLNLQYLLDGASAEWQRARADSQMTLGKLIDHLSTLPGKSLIEGFSNPHSYRGYYSDLAFEKTDQKILVSHALQMCRKAMGEVFCGYKGGDYQMGRNTPVWIAEYGSCGKKIMAMNDDGTLELVEDD